MLIASSALVLTACGSKSATSPTTSGSAGASTAPVTISYAYEQEFGAYNNNTADQNASKNAVVLNEVLRSFWQYSPDGKVQPDTEFGTFEKVSDSPLKVKYTFNAKAVWSDGVPIDCKDAWLTWAANSNAYPTGAKDKDGNVLYYFSTAGSTGYEQTDPPECNNGDKSFTITYKTPFADWNSLFGNASILPAHIVEQQTGVTDLIAALKAKVPATLKKIGDFYDTGWIFKPGQFNAAISPSAGPYVIATWQAGSSLTLKPNPKWWGTPPRSETIVFRYISQDQQSQALQNGEVQVMDPQPNPDLLQQLKGIGPSVQVSTHDQFTFEHYDFNFHGEFANKDLRVAFAKCLPRQTIVDNLIKPLNPDAKVLESRYLLPFQPAYDAVAASAGGSAYDKVDIAGAKAILTRLGKVGVQVRIGHNTPNPRRTSEVALIRASCDQAGFKIVDAGQDDFFGNGLANGNFDVALFAWSGSALVTASNSTYVTGGGNNNGHYSNPQVDALIQKLNQELDPDTQQQLIGQIEKLLWDDVATIPVFAFPAVLATAANVQGVQYNASQSDITYNVSQWSLKQ